MQLEQASVRTLLAAGRQADAQEAAAGLFNECRQAGLQVCCGQDCQTCFESTTGSAVHPRSEAAAPQRLQELNTLCL